MYFLKSRSIGGDPLNKSLELLLLLLMEASVLCGCFRATSLPLDRLPDTTKVTEDTTEVPEPPAINYEAVVGHSEYDLVAEDSATQKRLLSVAQTNLGNLCADAYRSATGADVAIVCASEIGDGIPRGDITVGDLYAAIPLECDLITVYATGAEILNFLEAAYQHLPRASSDFAHLSGITLVLDSNGTASVITDETGAFAGIEGDRRVTDVRIGDIPLLAEETYTVTYSGAFSYHIGSILEDNAFVSETAVSNRGAVMAYIADSLSGAVGEDYKNPFGDERIRVIPLGQTEAAAATSMLPQVYIVTDEVIKRRSYVGCTITVHDPKGVYDDVYDTESTVKIRGHSTSGGEKAPYNIKFGSKVELFGLGKSKKWNLLANLYDKTQLRNTLAYTFAQDIGLDYTSNSCFAEVYLNGEYRGIYQICEPVDVSKTQVDLDTENNEYLLELEPYAGYSNPYCVTTPVLKMVLGYNEPEEPTAEQRTWLKTFMTDAENAILSGDYNRVKEYVDVDSFARCYIVQELFKNVDYSVSSTRFYVKGNKLYEGPVWDFDLSSGNCSSSYYKPYNNVDTTGLSYEGLYCVSLFNQHLFRYEEFRQLVSDLYEEYQPQIVNLYCDNGLGKSRIDSLLSGYREAIDRNYTLWSTKKAYNLYEHRPVDGTYDGEIAYLKNWLQKRNEWLYAHYCTPTQ